MQLELAIQKTRVMPFVSVTLKISFGQLHSRGVTVSMVALKHLPDPPTRLRSDPRTPSIYKTPRSDFSSGASQSSTFSSDRDKLEVKCNLQVMLDSIDLTKTKKEKEGRD